MLRGSALLSQGASVPNTDLEAEWQGRRSYGTKRHIRRATSDKKQNNNHQFKIVHTANEHHTGSSRKGSGAWVRLGISSANSRSVQKSNSA